MPNERYQATSSTVIKATAYVSALVLAVLDEYGSEYFDLCEIESEILQRKIEDAIKVGCRRLAADLGTM
jgi:hypothetical protein